MTDHSTSDSNLTTWTFSMTLSNAMSTDISGVCVVHYCGGLVTPIYAATLASGQTAGPVTCTTKSGSKDYFYIMFVGPGSTVYAGWCYCSANTETTSLYVHLGSEYTIQYNNWTCANKSYQIEQTPTGGTGFTTPFKMNITGDDPSSVYCVHASSSSVTPVWMPTLNESLRFSCDTLYGTTDVYGFLYLYNSKVFLGVASVPVEGDFTKVQLSASATNWLISYYSTKPVECYKESWDTTS